jgi:hypothetical protein
MREGMDKYTAHQTQFNARLLVSPEIASITRQVEDDI